jgi:hypothetical protein
MAGTTRLNRCGAHYIHHKASTMRETPTQFLDEKKKEKALVEEMKQKYVTERGSCEIIIKRISDAETRMPTKIMACKLLKKFYKDEFPIRVVATATQCSEGTTLNWAPYFLKLFL